MRNTDYVSSLTGTHVGDLDRDYHLDESGTLEHLLDICQDGALGARFAAEGRPLSTASRREVHRQAEHIRTANARIHEVTQ